MGNLDGKIAIVTGAAQGIGFGCAKVLAQHGATVVLVDLTDAVAASAEELKKAGLKTDYRKCDVSNLEQVQQMVDDVVKTYGKIDILHNNAGVNRRVKFEDMDTKTRDFIIGVNILGVWNVARAVWPYMLKANYGRIINTSSVTGVKVVDEGQSTYALTKGAVLGFTKALAYEGGPTASPSTPFFPAGSALRRSSRSAATAVRRTPRARCAIWLRLSRSSACATSKRSAIWSHSSLPTIPSISPAPSR